MNNRLSWNPGATWDVFHPSAAPEVDIIINGRLVPDKGEKATVRYL